MTQVGPTEFLALLDAIHVTFRSMNVGQRVRVYDDLCRRGQTALAEDLLRAATEVDALSHAEQMRQTAGESDPETTEAFEKLSREGDGPW